MRQADAVNASPFEEEWLRLEAMDDDQRGPRLNAIALIAQATRGTPLRQLVPFTSMQQLCLARDSQHREILKAFVGVGQDGTLRVFDKGPYDEEVTAHEFRTTDPHEAVGRLLELLTLDESS